MRIEHLCTPCSIFCWLAKFQLHEKRRSRGVSRLKVNFVFCLCLASVSVLHGGIFTAVSELKGIWFALEQICQCRAGPRRISHSTGHQANDMNWRRTNRSKHLKALRVSCLHCIERICCWAASSGGQAKQWSLGIHLSGMQLIPLSALSNSFRKQRWSLEVKVLML